MRIGTWATGSGDMEGLVYGWPHVFDSGDQIVVLSHGESRAGDVSLLERVCADCGASDLSGYRDDRNRIHHRRGKPGDEVGRTRTRSCECDADFTRGASVTIGCVRRTLLVSYEHVAELRVPAQHAIQRQNRAAREAKYDIDAFVQKRLANNVAACKCLSHIVSFV